MLVSIAQLLQASLKDVGIEVVLDDVPVGTYLERAYRTFDFDLFAASTGGADPDILRLLFSSKNIPKNGVPDGNVTLLASPEVDGWLADGLATADTPARAAAYAKVQQYVIEHAVVVPIYVPAIAVGVSPKVQGLTWDRGGYFRLQGAWIAG